jgi:hypothetical protein
MTIEIAWLEGVPPMANLYLVAIELGTNGGYYAFSYWDGEKWSQAFPEKVIAFYPANQLIDQFNIKWPKPAPEGMDDDSDIPASMTDGDWEQVC